MKPEGVNPILDTSIEYLKGVGPQKADVLKKELGIFRYQDLLSHYPFRYADRTKFWKINEIESDTTLIQIIGEITRVETIGVKRSQRLVAHFTDETGTIELVWFRGAKWVKPTLKLNTPFVVYGKPSWFKGKYNIAHPEIETYDPNKKGIALESVYSTTEKLTTKGLGSKGVRKLMHTLMVQVKDVIPETLSAPILEKFKLIAKREALINVHFPSNQQLLNQAIARLKFEELFFTQLELVRQNLVQKQTIKGFVFAEVGNYFNDYYKNVLPFELTGAQKKVVKEIRKDLGAGFQMNRLLQGDVGSGKTIVALLSMLLALDNGFQAALMAPTEILANQHYESIKEALDKLDIEVGLLTGSIKKSTRKVLHEGLENGTIKILIGTHALIEDVVQFKNLGLVVIDEQHRFGVAQRARLWKKNERGWPHILVMTATPIPRTLAMTFYGDLDVSVIDELPPGRKPIKTSHCFENSRLKVFGFINDEVKKGRQVYIVYPLIKESEKLDYKDLMDGYESICRAFPNYKISIVHGQMKPQDKDFEMQRFVNGETQIMVATTVIEVGINVPNASIMVIESAEKFGLSQLHQLRGRVGRGADQSYCILMTGSKLSNEGKVRMRTMTGTNDGFAIAEADLKLRGPGDLMGTQQSGVLDLRIADLAKDAALLQIARDAAFDLVKDDPQLQKQENIGVANALRTMKKGRRNWSRIS